MHGQRGSAFRCPLRAIDGRSARHPSLLAAQMLHNTSGYTLKASAGLICLLASPVEACLAATAAGGGGGGKQKGSSNVLDHLWQSSQLLHLDLCISAWYTAHGSRADYTGQRFKSGLTRSKAPRCHRGSQTRGTAGAVRGPRRKGWPRSIRWGRKKGSWRALPEHCRAWSRP